MECYLHFYTLQYHSAPIIVGPNLRIIRLWKNLLFSAGLIGTVRLNYELYLGVYEDPASVWPPNLLGGLDLWRFFEGTKLLLRIMEVRIIQVFCS